MYLCHYKPLQIVFILMYDPDHIISDVITGTGSLVLIDGSVMKAVVELL